MIDDSSLDARATPIIQAAHAAPPSDAALEQAASIEEAPSPAMVESTARWLATVAALEAAGFSADQLLHLAVRASQRSFEIHGPGTALYGWLFARAPGRVATARALCEELLAKGVPVAQPLVPVANTALALLATEAALEERLLPLLTFGQAPPPVLRPILTALAPAAREALVLANAKRINARNACHILDKLLALRALVTTPAVEAALQALLEAGRADKQATALEARLQAPVAPDQPPVRPTAEARQALAYLMNKRAEARRAAGLGGLAEAAFARDITVDAPELRQLATWAAASDARRAEIAAAVGAALGADFRLVEFASYGGPPIAVFEHAGLRYSLVPGGTAQRGLSAEEEALIRARAATQQDSPSYFELYESLFEQLGVMRPVGEVTVGALLAGQAPGRVVDNPKATDLLEASRLRLPSEAEWEHLARGGKRGELTYRGNEVPDNEAWFEATAALGPRGANQFGLAGFGYEPEACADRWHGSHDGAPSDGSPRLGDGPRVVRGGAGQLYPWQSTGEWHLLLSAMRGVQTMWEFSLALRFVLGVRC